MDCFFRSSSPCEERLPCLVKLTPREYLVTETQRRTWKGRKEKICFLFYNPSQYLWLWKAFLVSLFAELTEREGSQAPLWSSRPQAVKTAAGIGSPPVRSTNGGCSCSEAAGGERAVGGSCACQPGHSAQGHLSRERDIQVKEQVSFPAAHSLIR